NKPQNKNQKNPNQPQTNKRNHKSKKTTSKEPKTKSPDKKKGEDDTSKLAQTANVNIENGFKPAIIGIAVRVDCENS
ncbi:hypothetical protein, partial [Acinetobacter baumannii]